MDAKKFDQLIKDQLYDHQSDVSNESWSKLEFILDSKEEDKPVVYLWPYWRALAAVFLLVAVSWSSYKGVHYWINTQEWKSNISLLNLEEIKYKTVSTSSIKAPVSYDLNKLALRSYTPVTQKDDILLSKPTGGEVSEIASVATNQDGIELLEPIFDQKGNEEVVYQSHDNQVVRITYKRSITEPTEEVDLNNTGDSVKTSRMVELLHATKDFQPGELLADVRSAKDKVLQNPFGINKQRQRFK